MTAMGAPPSRRFTPDRVALAVLLLVLCVLPFVVTGYVLYLVNLLMVFVILALGMHVVIGEAGQFALSHAAFFGVGNIFERFELTGIFYFAWSLIPAFDDKSHSIAGLPAVAVH